MICAPFSIGADPGFFASAMLVGDFALAQSCLNPCRAGAGRGIRAVGRGVGSSASQDRRRPDAGRGAPVRRAGHRRGRIAGVVWTGAPLSDAEVVAKLKGA